MLGLLVLLRGMAMEEETVVVARRRRTRRREEEGILGPC
jgi:hypothetical protein